MNTLNLKTFIEVVNQKSFSNAAEKLFLSQPAVTKQIQTMEKETGTVLLKREGRNIIPTQEGSELYLAAVNMLNIENKFMNKIGRSSPYDKQLAIYSSSTPAIYILSKIISEFSEEYTKTRYKIINTDSRNVYNSIENGETSFGFTGTLYSKKNIGNISIFEDELILIASADKYINLRNIEVDFDFLKKQDLIMRESGSATLDTFKDAIKIMKYSIKDFNIKIVAENSELIKKLVLNGMGISIISKLAVEKELRDGSLLQIKINNLTMKRNIYYIYHKKRYLSKIEQLFKEYIEKTYL